MSLCKYKNLFGKPDQGVHSYRIFNIAIVDTLLTILLAFVISFLTKLSFLYTLIISFASGIILHRLFCVRTTVDKLLFPHPNNY
jgi:hypothetical protein